MSDEQKLDQTPEEGVENKDRHTTTQGGEERPLLDFEKAWIVYQFCGIPYEIVRKIDESSNEMQFLMAMAALKKKEAEEHNKKQEARELDMESKLGNFADNLMQAKPPS